MTATIAFDVYGTLIDPLGISTKLANIVGDDAPQLAQLWRDKQIEYLFRRGLMGDYEDFAVCTRQALEYASERLQLSIGDVEKAALLAQYRRLPAYPEVPEALREIRKIGCRMYAFSNGVPGDLEALLAHAGLDSVLDGIVSVHDVRSFKPDPDVYRHFLNATDALAQETWLVSGNAFDVIGAHACGWQTAWLQRDPALVFDPWGLQPTVTVSALRDLATCLSQA